MRIQCLQINVLSHSSGSSRPSKFRESSDSPARLSLSSLRFPRASDWRASLLGNGEGYGHKFERDGKGSAYERRGGEPIPVPGPFWVSPLNISDHRRLRRSASPSAGPSAPSAGSRRRCALTWRRDTLRLPGDRLWPKSSRHRSHGRRLCPGGKPVRCRGGRRDLHAKGRGRGR
jgi:hypothetical protein